MKKLILLVLVGMLTGITFGRAQGCGSMQGMHNMNNMPSSTNSVAKHGGSVQQIGDYQVETVFDPRISLDLKFYVMDNNGVPVENKNISGMAIVTYQDGRSDTLSLQSLEVSSFSIRLQANGDSFTVFTTYKIDGRILTTYYQSNDQKVVYTCPMHTEIRSDKPGKCPKCGMDLVIKQ